MLITLSMIPRVHNANSSLHSTLLDQLWKTENVIAADNVLPFSGNGSVWEGSFLKHVA